MKKVVSFLLIFAFIFCVAIPASAQEFSTSEPIEAAEPRYVPTEVPEYFYDVCFYDGGYYLSPVYYKEIRLPNANSTYTSELVVGYRLEDTYFNNIKVNTLIKWEYRYTIN